MEARTIRPLLVGARLRLRDQEEDDREGTSRALRRPSWDRNAGALSVRCTRGRNRRNRRSVVWTRLLLPQDQRQGRQFIHFALRRGPCGVGADDVPEPAPFDAPPS